MVGGNQNAYLSLAMINSAANIFFVVNGKNKAPAMQSVFSPDLNKSIPAAKVQPDGNILWLVDKDAASMLLGHTLPLEVSQW